ncbi:GAF domain-containing sensor histidine kinase [Mucilaginibacter aquaedulcis]|uniref:GAF domain-containing sensor histidine kinase n=1 Tax=Mucilaginibacter aquaedulcis TaxID=1187081 RepID=UPI0025B37DD7|nr:GAF domain-containing sensor histidine kinase [Mucilaginibacter aquaedulcis]MDN3548167.1 GAF domain-containing sensor histidine kinase [Mucilaginibacter aquaedulcis]
MDTIRGANFIPENDAERVAALERYQIIGSQRETAFDSICRLACELFSVPFSHISFLDADTEYIKAEVGLQGIERVGRAEGFCALAILQPEVMLIEDASRHAVLASHPYVTGNLMIRFYAAAPVITPDGFIIGTLCLIDQTPRGLSDKEQELLQHLARVVMEQTELRNDNINLLQQRDQFIEVASHEMRTPLTALKAAAQILDKKHPEDSILVAHVNRSVQKLSNMVNDMFDAIRLKEKTFNLNRTSFSLSTLIVNCLDHIRLVSKIELQIEGESNFKIIADEVKIERVIINLVQNAIKYAPGSTITIHTQKLPGFAKINVTDRGPGIEPQKLPHIFRRYYRSDPSGIQTGLGLGLYISAEIVKQHGGDIGVDSQPGIGSTFWFTLPVSF